MPAFSFACQKNHLVIKGLRTPALDGGGFQPCSVPCGMSSFATSRRTVGAPQWHPVRFALFTTPFAEQRPGPSLSLASQYRFFSFEWGRCTALTILHGWFHHSVDMNPRYSLAFFIIFDICFLWKMVTLPTDVVMVPRM